MSFPLVFLADKNPDKLSHLRYNIEVVKIERPRSSQFFIQKAAHFALTSFSITALSNSVCLGEGAGGGCSSRFQTIQPIEGYH